MNTILKFTKCFISINKYPRYIEDIYNHLIYRKIMDYKGIYGMREVLLLGKPIITLSPETSISIGKKTVLCSRSTQTALGVNHPVVIRTVKEGASITIGSGVRMSGATICSATRVEIGSRCVIGANAMIVDTDFHSLAPSIRSSVDDAKLSVSKPVIIGDDVFIGGSSIILKGVTIGNGSVIGAGSVVSRNVSDGEIVAGNPAKIVGRVKSLENNY